MDFKRHLLKDIQYLVVDYVGAVIIDDGVSLSQQELDEYSGEIKNILFLDYDLTNVLLFKQHNIQRSIGAPKIRIKNLNQMFKNSHVNLDLSGWDVSEVTNMEGMFHNFTGNLNLSDWDASAVTNMKFMFYKFKGDLD
jgi:surface protein